MLVILAVLVVEHLLEMLQEDLVVQVVQMEVLVEEEELDSSTAQAVQVVELVTQVPVELEAMEEVEVEKSLIMIMMVQVVVSEKQVQLQAHHLVPAEKFMVTYNLFH